MLQYSELSEILKSEKIGEIHYAWYNKINLNNI